MHWLEMLLVAMLFTAIFRMIVGFLNEIYLYRIKGKLAIVSNASFMWHMLHLPMDFYAQRMVGDLAGRQKLNDQIAETLIAKYVFGRDQGTGRLCKKRKRGIRNLCV